MEDFYWKRHPDGPFATLIAVATGHFHPESPCPALLRRRANREPDEEMHIFKAELREAVMHPGRLPGDELSDSVQHDYGSDAAFLEQLWRYLYGDEPVAGPGLPEASRRATRPDGAALLYESVRTVTAVVIPAGAEGIILHTRSDGSRRAELVIAPRTEEYGDDDDDDGGLVEVTLAEGRYEVIPPLCQNWTLHRAI